MKFSFPVLERNPQARFANDWFYGPLAEHAEAFITGQLRRVVVTLPSGTYKSRTWAVCLIAYAWLRFPYLRFLIGTNDESLGYQHSTDTRTLIRSPWYLSFGPDWEITEDQDSKKVFANTQGGRRQMVPVGGTVSGKKGHRLILDDVHDARRVHSAAERTNDKLWFRQAFWDRQDDMMTSGVAIIGHRTHTDDLQSELIAEGWPEFRLPERWEERLRKTWPLGGSDPRQEGEYLRPSRFGPEQERDAKAVEGEQGWEGKHQQKPVASTATMFPSDKVTILPAAPAGTVGVRFWDTASTTGEASAHTSGVWIGRAPDKRWVIADVHRGKWTPAKRDAEIKRVAFMDRHRFNCTTAAIWREQEPGGSGVTAEEYFIRDMSGFNVRSHKETGDKVVRAQPLSAQWCAGNVVLVEGSWNAGYLDRMANFPGLKDKDDTDATSGGFNVQALGAAVDVEPAAATNEVNKLPPGVLGNGKVDINKMKF